jgi:hypothetical protein
MAEIRSANGMTFLQALQQEGKTQRNTSETASAKRSHAMIAFFYWTASRTKQHGLILGLIWMCASESFGTWKAKARSILL